MERRARRCSSLSLAKHPQWRKVNWKLRSSSHRWRKTNRRCQGQALLTSRKRMKSLRKKSWKSNKSFKIQSLKTIVATTKVPKGALTGKEHLLMMGTTVILTKQRWEDPAKAPSKGAATGSTSQWEIREPLVNPQEKDPAWIAEAPVEQVHTAETATLTILTIAWVWVSWTVTLATLS